MRSLFFLESFSNNYLVRADQLIHSNSHFYLGLMVVVVAASYGSASSCHHVEEDDWGYWKSDVSVTYVTFTVTPQWTSIVLVKYNEDYDPTRVCDRKRMLMLWLSEINE